MNIEMSSSTDPVGRRATLLPLISKNGSTFSAIPSHFCSHLLHNPKLTSWTQTSLCDYGVGKREINRGAAVVSSRWNPTAEQVQALEEMYRRGTRTPSAEQIQQITAKLRRFGKIEGKNVFYWFQNHKARDRQKKRRQLELLDGKNHDIPRTNQSGLSRKYLEMEHPKKLPTTSKCSTGSKYDGGEVEGCKRDRWPQFELQQQSETANRPLDLSSCCMSPNLSMPKIINQNQENAHPPLVALDLCKLLSSSNYDVFESGMKEDRTLELFPVRGSGSSTLCSTNKEEMDDDDVSSAGTKLVPNQFFEFLPTKN